MIMPNSNGAIIMTLTSATQTSSSDKTDSVSQDQNIIPANGDRNPDGLNGDHDITYFAKHRHTVKAFDPDRKITAENVDKIRDLLRFSPSSTIDRRTLSVQQPQHPQRFPCCGLRQPARDR